MKRTVFRFSVALIIAAQASLSGAAPEGSSPATIIPVDYLVLPSVGQYGRLPLHRDTIEAELVAGTWKPPAAGDTVTALDGGQEIWQAVAARDGTLDAQGHRGGYAFTTFDAPDNAIMLLEASGHALVYVNGQPHAGDPYKLGWLRIPVRVQKGSNTLLFHLAGDKLTARLTTPTDDVLLDDADRTLPTVLRENAAPVWAAIPVINTTDDILNDIQIVCRTAGDESRTTRLTRIPPLSVRKVAFELPAVKDLQRREVNFEVLLTHGDDYRPLARTELTARVVDATDLNVRTFRSRIDGSAQSYAIRPAADSSGLDLDTPGVVVTLHDAGKSGEDHLTRYAPKSWAHTIAPQGRRPHGFDWESWGAVDVLEVLADAATHYSCDPTRTCLTGHGMGGHGVWYLGVTFPDRFAAIGPSAGWISFWSYGGGMGSFENTPANLQAMLLRSYTPSDTLKLLTNLANTGVYVLHDSAEVDVPVEQARLLRERLAAFHANFVYLEPTTAELKSTDASAEWPRMMSFFEHAQRPTPQEQTWVDFTTADPGISAECDWITIDAQTEPLVPSRVVMRQDRHAHTFAGSTTNVARLAIDAHQLPSGQRIDVLLDNQPLQAVPRSANGSKLWLEQHDGKWTIAEPPPAKVKSANRSGTFNAAFDNNVLLVYGTNGTDDEDRWAEAKARFDAETFYYRADGALEVMPDVQFSAPDQANRNVILYGNADTNSAWAALLSDSPVDVRRGSVSVGAHRESGDDLAVVMVRPRPDSDTALVGVVGGTGPVGMRLTNRLRWYVSGITYPDLMIFGPKVLTEGTSDIRAWGFFGPDWGAEDSQIVWRSVL